MDRLSRTAERAQRERAEILDAAIADLGRVGWRRLRFRVVTDAGNGGATVHDLFSTREDIVVGLVEHLFASFWDGFDGNVELKIDGAHAGWYHAVHALLGRGAVDPALRAMLDPLAREDFLRVLTVDSGRLLADARVRVAASMLRIAPGADPADVHEAAEIVVRLVLSHAVRPLDSIDDAAHAVSSMIVALVS